MSSGYQDFLCLQVERRAKRSGHRDAESVRKLARTFHVSDLTIQRNCRTETFSQQWIVLVATSSALLERNDRNRMSQIRTYEDVIEKSFNLRSGDLSASAQKELNVLPSALKAFLAFVDFVSGQIKPAIDSAYFWGVVGLIVEVREQSIVFHPLHANHFRPI